MNNEINLKTFLLSLWKEKILIIGVCLFFSISAFVYQNSKINKNEQKITIHLSDPIMLNSQIRYFDDILPDNNNNNNNNNKNDYIAQYRENFKNNFLSRDNFANFINQNKNSNQIKKWFIENNVNIKHYLNENRFSHVKDKKFYIILPSQIDKLPNIIDEYTFFIKDLTIEETRNFLQLKILSELKKNQQALNVAKIINLQNPLLQSDKDNSSRVISEPREIFYLGEKVLNEKIINLNKLLTELSVYNFNYNPILINSSPEQAPVDRVFMSVVAGLLFGFFLSVSVIYLKKI